MINGTWKITGNRRYISCVAVSCLIRVQNENSSIFTPITSMLVISILLSLIMNLFLRE
ncbi:MAG: DUF2905 domain-containing protein [Methylococcales bacterium]